MLAGRFDNMYGSLRALAVNLGIQDNVRFLGQVADISILLGAIDLGVFSSRFEGCPNGVLECMAAGLAVVATDIPGIREAVGPSVYRFLVPPGDAEALANKIIELAADPCLRAELGKLNAHRAREVFSLERMGKQTADLISGWLNRDMPCAG
jgi:glycosyltransferase involved in cell wall biosynthesis